MEATSGLHRAPHHNSRSNTPATENGAQSNESTPKKVNEGAKNGARRSKSMPSPRQTRRSRRRGDRKERKREESTEGAEVIVEQASEAEEPLVVLPAAGDGDKSRFLPNYGVNFSFVVRNRLPRGNKFI